MSESTNSSRTDQFEERLYSDTRHKPHVQRRASGSLKASRRVRDFYAEVADSFSTYGSVRNHVAYSL